MARQYLLPGQGYINEAHTRQYLIPGWGFLNDSVPVKTSSAGITETGDTLAASASVSTSSFTSSAAITESGDTLAALGTVGAVTSSSAMTEGGDTLAAAGATGPLSGSASLSEGSDTLAASDLLAFLATSSLVESVDTLASSAAVVAIGTSAAMTDSADTLAASSLIKFFATSAMNEGGDSFFGFGIKTVQQSRQYLIPGMGYLNESNFRQYLIPGFGYVNESIYPSLSGIINVTETGDTLAGSAAVSQPVTSSSAITETDDTLAGSLTVGSGAISISGAITEGGDVLGSHASKAAVHYRQYLIPGMGYINETNVRQYLMPRFGYVNESAYIDAVVLSFINESPDILTASCILTLPSASASGDILEDVDILSSEGSTCDVIGGDIVELSDIFSGDISSYFSGFAGFSEFGDILAAFVGRSSPTPAIRIFDIPVQRRDFVITQARKKVFKTPAEIDLYSIDFSDELGIDFITSAISYCPDGSLSLNTVFPGFSGNISSAYIGGGDVVPSKASVLKSVRTAGNRVIEDGIDFVIRDFNFIPDLVVFAGFSDVLDYKFNWSTRMINGSEAIVSSSWRFNGFDNALNISSPPPVVFNSPASTVVWISEGTYQSGYVITNTIRTSLGRTLEASIMYFVNRQVVIKPPEDDLLADDGQNYFSDDGDIYIADN